MLTKSYQNKELRREVQEIIFENKINSQHPI